MYRTERNYENLNKGIFPGAGRFDIPILRPELTTAENWISFNYAKGCEDPSEHGVHFFVDDYQFNRIWAHPDNYLGMMARFDTVCTPDFSTYTDFPRIIQIYNHYRKHWLGAYWQAHGIKVIPTISWSTPDSFAWCFDGEPIGGAVAVPIYRTVNDSDDDVQGISMTSDDICDMMTDGSLSYVGRGVHGDGLYFSDSKRGSKLYGNPGQNPKTLRAVLNPAKARAISESSLQSAYDAFVKSHPRTRRALGFAKAHSTSDSMSQFALLMGYNVITTKVGYNETYYTVIDRSALIMSKTRV